MHFIFVLIFGDQSPVSTVPCFFPSISLRCVLVAFDCAGILLQISPSSDEDGGSSLCTALVSWTLQVIRRAFSAHNYCHTALPTSISYIVVSVDLISFRIYFFNYLSVVFSVYFLFLLLIILALLD